MVRTFVITWAPGPRWIEGVSLYDQPYIEEHADHLDHLMADHRVVLSGPFTAATGVMPASVGMTVVAAPDEVGLRAWLVGDPAIVNEVLQAEVRAFQVVFEAGTIFPPNRDCCLKTTGHDRA